MTVLRGIKYRKDKLRRGAIRCCHQIQYRYRVHGPNVGIWDWINRKRRLFPPPAAARCSTMTGRIQFIDLNCLAKHHQLTVLATILHGAILESGGCTAGCWWIWFGRDARGSDKMGIQEVLQQWVWNFMELLCEKERLRIRKRSMANMHRKVWSWCADATSI